VVQRATQRRRLQPQRLLLPPPQRLPLEDSGSKVSQAATANLSGWQGGGSSVFFARKVSEDDRDFIESMRRVGLASGLLPHLFAVAVVCGND